MKNYTTLGKMSREWRTGVHVAWPGCEHIHYKQEHHTGSSGCPCRWRGWWESDCRSHVAITVLEKKCKMLICKHCGIPQLPWHDTEEAEKLVQEVIAGRKKIRRRARCLGEGAQRGVHQGNQTRFWCEKKIVYMILRGIGFGHWIVAGTKNWTVWGFAT